ncbi:CBO0543 family protein [Lentibacillus kapialis]|uniref:CBO0543 family protein n=1 Tax=Lentibacillus kapialis TaxID=340214 RepID=UPI00166CB340|nr:CBO0543 family protein [Lentibacillus kapialis]
MHLLIILLAVLVAWRSVNWRSLYEYHATILYMVAMNLLYYFFTVDYRLWTLHSHIGLPPAVIDLVYTFVLFPITTLMFLNRYPQQRGKQIVHTGKWVMIYFIFESIGYLFGAIRYHHGWSLIWSGLFLVVMFPMLRLHYKRSLWAYSLSVVIITFLLYWFEVPWLKSNALCEEW